MPLNHQFLDQILRGDKAALAKAISIIENDHRDARPLLRQLYPHTGKAYRIGITGPPGAGKSTISNKLAKLYRTARKRVGIIAVDPTSPFTGGALLGDRVRMTDVELDSGVFIRSMASRGSLGGLSRNTGEAADVLDASGCDMVLLETVGVGQSELDIVRAADTTVVVLTPESGDSIQAMKAGLMEIADFFILNKADRAGAEQAVMAIKMVMSFRPPHNGWNVEVIQSVANDDNGIDKIAENIAAHQSFLIQTDRLRRKRKDRIAERVRELIGERLRGSFWTDDREKHLAAKVDEVVAQQLTPYDLVDDLLKDFSA